VGIILSIKPSEVLKYEQEAFWLFHCRSLFSKIVGVVEATHARFLPPL